MEGDPQFVLDAMGDAGIVKEALQSWTRRRGKKSPRACNAATLAIMWVI